MKYVECPEVYDGNESNLFLAGGISGCSDWQKEMVELLEGEDLVVVNPRRKGFDMDDKTMEKKQILWEYEHLEKADIVSFWFASETICPITLYELGEISKMDKVVFVGIDPGYVRKKDVEIQMSLIRPNVEIVYSIEDLARQVKNEIR